MRKFVLFGGLLALAACHKAANTAPDVDFGVGDGFSHRTSANVPNGSQDATDWTTDTTWSAQEIGLFSDNLAKLDLNGTQQANFLNYTAVYPNPGREATWEIRPLQPTGSFTYNVEAMLVDHNYQRIRAFTSLSVGSDGYSILFNYAQLGLHPGERYRLYYVFYNRLGLLYKGHGDLRYDQ